MAGSSYEDVYAKQSTHRVPSQSPLSSPHTTYSLRWFRWPPQLHSINHTIAIPGEAWGIFFCLLGVPSPKWRAAAVGSGGGGALVYLMLRIIQAKPDCVAWRTPKPSVNVSAVRTASLVE